jgi:hypothetical protein
MERVRGLMALQIATFALAALVHLGLLVPGYEHVEARIAESVIAAVLVTGLVVGWISTDRARGAALVAQAFALFGTLVGLVTIALGVGPRTALDLALHGAMVLLLVTELVLTRSLRAA